MWRREQMNKWTLKDEAINKIWRERAWEIWYFQKRWERILWEEGRYKNTIGTLATFVTNEGLKKKEITLVSLSKWKVQRWKFSIFYLCTTTRRWMWRRITWLKRIREMLWRRKNFLLSRHLKLNGKKELLAQTNLLTGNKWRQRESLKRITEHWVT